MKSTTQIVILGDFVVFQNPNLKGSIAIKEYQVAAADIKRLGVKHHDRKNALVQNIPTAVAKKWLDDRFLVVLSQSFLGERLKAVGVDDYKIKPSVRALKRWKKLFMTHGYCGFIPVYPISCTILNAQSPISNRKS